MQLDKTLAETSKKVSQLIPQNMGPEVTRLRVPKERALVWPVLSYTHFCLHMRLTGALDEVMGIIYIIASKE